MNFGTDQMTVLALATVAALGDNYTYLLPWLHPQDRTSHSRSGNRWRPGQDISLQPNLPKPSLRGPARLQRAGEGNGHLQTQCLTPSNPSLLGVFLFLLLPRVSQCLFFFSTLLQTPPLGLRHLPAAPLSWAMLLSRCRWVGRRPLLSPGQRGLQQAEGGQVLHSRPLLQPHETEDRNENLRYLAG